MREQGQRKLSVRSVKDRTPAIEIAIQILTEMGRPSLRDAAGNVGLGTLLRGRHGKLRTETRRARPPAGNGFQLGVDF
jgi:hypothetical protein